MAEFSLSQHTDSIYSIIGEGTRFKGEFEVNGLLRIDGDFSGTIKTSGKVLVSKNGRAECSIFGGTIIVGGIVKGSIVAFEKVEILSSGMVIGTITAPRLIVNEGVLLHGKCAINPNSVMPYNASTQNNGEKSVGLELSAESEQVSQPEAVVLEKNII